MQRPFVVPMVMLIGAVIAGFVAFGLSLTADGTADVVYAVVCFFWGMALYLLLYKDPRNLGYLLVTFLLGGSSTFAVANLGNVHSPYSGGVLSFTFLCIAWGMAFYSAAVRPSDCGFR